MKLLVQGDDYGFTKAVTLGILEGIENGILRNTGMFTNMPSSEFAASRIKDYPQACFGIDFNIVSGMPVADPALIPHLVDQNNEFIRSGVRIRNELYQTDEGQRQLFPYEEVYCEIKAQYDRFIQLTGQKPGYLHGHSIQPVTYIEAIQALSKETGVPFSHDIRSQFHFREMARPSGGVSKTKIFDPIAQLNKDTLSMVMEQSEEILKSEYAAIGGHPGYIDAELLGLTSLSLERCKDLEMLTSDTIKQWVKDNDIELITYYDLVKAL